ncbi:MAG: AAA family ATPase [Candidatus Micrarchaeia archaeon]
MSGIIIVAGTQGAGKTSILSSLHERYKIVNMGTEILEKASTMFGIKNRDEIRYLEPEQIKKARELALKRLALVEDNMILDTHMFAVRGGTRFVAGFTIKELKILKRLKGFIYIDADPEEIIKRRENDKTRNRDPVTEEQIKNEKIFNLTLIGSYAAEFGIPVYIIKNENGKLEEAIKQIEEAIKEVFKID